MQASKATGQMNMQRLLDMQEQGINVKDVTSDELRATMYSKEVIFKLSTLPSHRLKLGNYPTDDKYEFERYQSEFETYTSLAWNGKLAYKLVFVCSP